MAPTQSEIFDWNYFILSGKYAIHYLLKRSGLSLMGIVYIMCRLFPYSIFSIKYCFSIHFIKSNENIRKLKWHSNRSSFLVYIWIFCANEMHKVFLSNYNHSRLFTLSFTLRFMAHGSHSNSSQSERLSLLIPFESI